MNTTFPKWAPKKNSTINRLDPFEILWGDKQKLFLHAIRRSSEAFTLKREVREFVFSRDNYRCVNCNSDKDLQVDHIISVYACSRGKIPVSALNSETNLQTLCRRCNAAKKP